MDRAAGVPDTTSRSSDPGLLRAEIARVGLTSERIPDEGGTKVTVIWTLPAADGSTRGGIVLPGHTDGVPVDGQAWDDLA